MGEQSQLFDIEDVEQVDPWDRPRRGGNIHAAAKELSAGGYQRVGKRIGIADLCYEWVWYVRAGSERHSR